MAANHDDTHPRRRGLWLPGWDDCSVWGWNPELDAYYAELWRNPNPDRRVRQICVATWYALAREIARVTGADLIAVVKAMLAIDPDTLDADEGSRPLG